MNMHTAPGLDAALALAAAGLPVFPAGPDKRPRVKWKEAATTDADTLAEWWRRLPDSVPCVPMGAASGLFCVDADIDRATGEAVGEASLAALGVDVAGHIARTRSGGAHIFYDWKPDFPRNSAGKVLGVDIRSEGGYVCAWAPDVLIAAKRDPFLPDPPAPLLRALRGEDRSQGFDFDAGVRQQRQERTAGFTFDTDHGRVRKRVEDYRRLAQGCWTDGRKHDSSRDLAASFAAQGVSEDCATGMILALVPPYGHDKLLFDAIRSGFEKFRRDRETEETAQAAQTLRPTPFALRDPAQIPPRQWLYGRHMIGGFVSLTVSPGGLGKSSAALVEALAMVTGRPLLGDAPPRPLRVWAWNGEDPRDEIERRVAAACLHYGVTPDEIGDRLHTDSGRDVPISLASMGKAGVQVARPQVEAMVATIAEARIDVLIVDPFVTCHSVAENDNAAINAVVALWREIADRTGCAVELVHHAQKLAHTNGNDLGIAQSRGASALIDGVRSARYLVAMTEDEAGRAGVETHRGFFRVEMGKANLAPIPERATWRRMVSVALGNGAGLYPEGDFVGVATAWEWPDAFDGVQLADLEAVKARLREGDWKASEQADAWAGHAVAAVLGLDAGPVKKAERNAKQNAARAKVRALIKTWLRNGELVEVERIDPRNRRPTTFIETPEGGEDE